MGSALKPAILYLGKDKFDLWGGNFIQVLSFVFPPELVRDLDVLNHDGLIISVQSFIERNKIPPLRIVLILSETICFEKEVPENSTTFEREDMLNSFADMVPFDRVSRKIVKIDGKPKIVGANKILWDTIRECFANQGSVILTVVPSSALGLADIQSSFDPKYARAAFTKAENLKEANFLETPGENGSIMSSDSKPVNHNREILLGGVFFLLLIILAVLIIIMKPFSPPVAPPKDLPVAPSPFAASASPTPEGSGSAEVQGIMDEKSIIVYVTASEKEKESADLLENRLIQKGFKEIRINFSPSSPDVRSITFPQKITEEKRNAVISSVKPLFEDIKINTSITKGNTVDIDL